MTGKINYKTSTGRKVAINYHFKTISPKSVPVDKKTFVKACKDGCKNYNQKWSCPPCSPDFNKIKHKKYFLVILLSIDGKYFSDCTEWMKVKAINSVLKSKVDKIVKKIETASDGYAYISGSCRICRICAKRTDDHCRYPKNMRYSLEAVGIDCNRLAKKIFDQDLCWYTKNNKKYGIGSVLGAIEINQKIDSKTISELILNTLR